jgi:hypothetical protein
MVAFIVAQGDAHRYGPRSREGHAGTVCDVALMPINAKNETTNIFFIIIIFKVLNVFLVIQVKK